jgi:hypothetical protein
MRDKAMKRVILTSLALFILVAPTEYTKAYDLSGKLRIAGVLMSTMTSIEPTIWLRDEGTGSSYVGAVTSYYTDTGAYELKNLTGTIGVSIVFHVRGTEETLPGNYRLCKVVDDTTPTTLNLEVPVIIHVTSPWDNDVIRNWIPPYPYYSSPVTFQWDVVPVATRFAVRIQKCTNTGCTDILGDSSLATNAYTVHL